MRPRPNRGQSRELVRLATLDRKNGDEQFRISVDEFQPDDDREPKKYLSLRVWYQDQKGEWRPSKTGCTLRQSEFVDAIKALQKGARIVVGREPLPEPPRPQPSPAQRTAQAVASFDDAVIDEAF